MLWHEDGCSKTRNEIAFLRELLAGGHLGWRVLIASAGPGSGVHSIDIVPVYRSASGDVESWSRGHRHGTTRPPLPHVYQLHRQPTVSLTGAHPHPHPYPHPRPHPHPPLSRRHTSVWGRRASRRAQRANPARTCAWARRVSNWGRCSHAPGSMSTPMSLNLTPAAASPPMSPAALAQLGNAPPAPARHQRGLGVPVSLSPAPFLFMRLPQRPPTFTTMPLSPASTTLKQARARAGSLPAGATGPRLHLVHLAVAYRPFLSHACIDPTLVLSHAFLGSLVLT
ncbi:hypothetical protein K491DRAFT_136462 [Lophiostoma macrostomum CBS 122681]|uniref:Uncharacterized protein n=1 Tax=Lophiostoma macrostomum CBS 122681 TaxID=1314788 RepID=A0A6A6TK54_9PLEO|nr:hypothetical protein K491DRAFT_136462 [Lophiostoma macrostomum CBS 122681]